MVVCKPATSLRVRLLGETAITMTMGYMPRALALTGAGAAGLFAGWAAWARQGRVALGAVVDALSDPALVVDARGRLVRANGAWRAALGPDAARTGRPLLDLVAPEGRARCAEVLAAVRTTGVAEAVELIFLAADGARVALVGSINPAPGHPDGGSAAWAVFRPAPDPTRADAAAEARLAYQAFHDPLSGLPNRAFFLGRLAHARARRDGAPIAVLFLDLDRFKVVNDSLGHDAGDLLLSSVGDRLLRAVRPVDTVARLGGDEFVVLLEDIAGVEAAVEIAGRCVDELRGAFVIGRHEVVVTVSVGVALGVPGADGPDADGEDDAGDLLRQADMALYAAKEAGRARHAVFDAAMGAQARERFTLEADLRRGLERGEFVVYYMPIAALGTSRIVGMEALVRWEHPERGLLPPAAFIELAEETGLIADLGWWVLGEACRQARLWRDAYPTDPPTVAVNLAVRQFEHPDLLATVGAALAKAGLEARLLELEITESGVMRAAEANLPTLRALAALGVGVAIDDFGTGHSSLAVLRRLPVGTLKIDRSFIDGLGHDPQDTEIVRAVVALAKTLGRRVTAEGVETADQVARLRELGCDQGQGYHFWRPRPAAAAGALLSADRRAVGDPKVSVAERARDAASTEGLGVHG